MSAPASYIATERGLREGLGVEDIAYRSGHPVELIRRHVTAMRRNGVLARMFGASA